MFDATVVANSRDWICVRLATYESKLEGTFLESIYTGRSGLLENTTFALLAPDGKTRLGRAGRGPQHVTGTRRGPPSRRSGPPGATGEGVDKEAAGKMSALMAAQIKRYEAKAKIRALPQNLDFRRALNVAACDNQPLVVAYAKSKSARAAMEKMLAELAWSDAYVGRLQYLIVSDAKDLASIKKVPSSEGIYFLQPDRFGLEGEVLASIGTKATAAATSLMLNQALASFKTSTKNTREHKRAARREGVETWETEIPVTDPGLPPGRRGGGR